MKIAYIQGEYGGAQIKGYPHSRDFLPTLGRLVDDGHDVIQVFPCYTENGNIKRWFDDPVQCKNRLQEHFNLGVKPFHDWVIPDADIVLMYAVPWENMQNRDVVEILKSYTEIDIPIYYYCADFELENTQSGKTIIFDHIYKKYPEVWDNIKGILTSIPSQIPRIKEMGFKGTVEYYPTQYGPRFEIENPKPLSERKYAFSFGGPIGFRRNMANNMFKIIEATNRGIRFFNESDKESKKARANNPVDVNGMFGKYATVSIYDKPLYLSYPDWIMEHSNSVFGIGDSTFPEMGIDSKINMHTSRVMDALYAGSFPLMTDTFTLQEYLPKGMFDSMNIEALEVADFKTLMCFDDARFADLVSQYRAAFNDTFGIDKYIKVLYKMIGEKNG